MNVTIPIEHIAAFIDSLLNGGSDSDDKQHAFVLLVCPNVEGMQVRKAMILSNMDKLNAEAIMMQAVASTIEDEKEH